MKRHMTLDPLTGFVGSWRSLAGILTEKYMEALGGFGRSWRSQGESLDLFSRWMEFEYMTIDRKNEIYRIESRNHAREMRATARRIRDDAIQYECCINCGAFVPFVGDPQSVDCCCCGLGTYRYTWAMHLDGEELEKSNLDIQQRVYAFEARHGLPHDMRHYEQGFALLERGLMPEADPQEESMGLLECPEADDTMRGDRV